MPKIEFNKRGPQPAKEEVMKWAELYKSGLSQLKIAKKIKVPLSRVEYQFKKYKVKLRTKDKGPSIPTKDVPKIKERRKSGETIASIAETYGVTLSAVWYACSKKYKADKTEEELEEMNERVKPPEMIQHKCPKCERVYYKMDDTYTGRLPYRKYCSEREGCNGKYMSELLNGFNEASNYS